MTFVNLNGPNIVIEDPSLIDFSTLPAPRFFKIMYTLIYNELDSTKLYPHINFDNFNKRLLLWLSQRYDVRAAVNQLFDKKTSLADWRKNPPQKALLQFLRVFPAFYIFFQNVNADVDISIQNAESLIGSRTTTLNFIDIKKNIDQINRQRWTREKDVPEKNSGVSILGNISEQLLETAMNDLIDNVNFFRSTISAVQSYGDFVLMCLPNNLWLSVKSNFARERLLASGYTTDIVGVGFFTDATEFTSQAKIRNFAKVGFLAMYVPDIPITDAQIASGLSTYDEINNYYTNAGMPFPQNINGTTFIRRLSSLYGDLQVLLNVTDVRRRNTIRF